MRRSNVPIHVDTGMKIGHIGKYVFKYDDFLAQLESGALDEYVQAEGEIDDNSREPDKTDSDAS